MPATERHRRADTGPGRAQEGAERRSPRPKVAGRARAQKRGKGALRESSKKAEVLGLLGRKPGATLAEIMKATGWQPHTLRGFISIASTREGITIESAKNEAGDGVYRITK